VTGTLLSRPSTTTLMAPAGLRGFDPSQKLYLDAQGGFALDDIADQARATTATFSHRDWDNAKKALGPTTEREVSSVVVRLRAERRADFDAWVKKTVDPHITTWLVILDHDRWIAAAEMDQKAHRFVRFGDIAIATLCTKTESPTLPADIVAP
jgi:hypothetical protein